MITRLLVDLKVRECRYIIEKPPLLPSNTPYRHIANHTNLYLPTNYLASYLAT